MTLQELTGKLYKIPITCDQGKARQVKLAFLLNLMALTCAGMEATDEQILDARDALESSWARKMISEILGLPWREEGGRYARKQPKLADPHQRTVMPIQMLAESREDITKRIVSFLRPDPRMLVEVQKMRVDSDPGIDIYHVVIEDGRGGSWNETFATEDLLMAFLKGIKVTYAMSDLQKLLPSFGNDAPVKFTEQSAVQHI